MTLKTSQVFSATIFFGPLLFFSVGSFSIFKIFLVLLLFIFILEFSFGKMNLFLHRNLYYSLILKFLAYVILITIFLGFLGVINYSSYQSLEASKPVNRFITQLFSFIEISVLTVYVYKFAKINPSLIVKPISLVIGLLLIVSLYEVISIYFDFPKIPMYLTGEIALVNQNFSTLLDTYRVHSLAGEPRFYATILSIILNSTLFYFIGKYKKISFSKKIKYCCFLLYLFFLIIYTQSTSGLILFPLLVLFTFLVSKDFNFLKRAKFLLILFLLCLVFYPLLSDVFEKRVLERIKLEMLSEQIIENSDAALVEIPYFGLISFDATDATPLVLLLDKPYLIFTGIGWGNISTYVKPYLPDYGGYWGYGFQGIVEPNISLLKNILVYGFIGNFLMIYLFFLFYKDYRRNEYYYSDIQKASFYVLVSVFICNYTLSGPLINPVWFYAFHAGVLSDKSNKDRPLLNPMPSALKFSN